MIKTGVYLIFCLANEKLYVGSSAALRGIKRRFSDHRLHLVKGIHCNKKLQASWNKYGEDAFLFSPIEYVEPSRCIEREQFWMDRLKPNFNLAPTAGNCLGVKHSEEARKRNSLSHKGKRRSHEHIANAIAGRRGYKHSEETRLKMSIAQKGKKQTLETRAKNAAAHLGINKGKKLSPEHVAKIGAASRGRKWPLASRLKMSIVQKGKKLSLEHREKIKKSHNTEEYKSRISRALTGIKRSIDFKLKLTLHTGAKNPNSRPVFCAELDKKFESASLAAKFLRETTNPKAGHSAIAACARGEIKRPHAYGYTWRYL